MVWICSVHSLTRCECTFRSIFLYIYIHTFYFHVALNEVQPAVLFIINSALWTYRISRQLCHSLDDLFVKLTASLVPLIALVRELHMKLIKVCDDRE